MEEPSLTCTCISGRETRNMAAAGVGNPVKLLILLLRLNLTSLIAAHRGIIMEINGKTWIFWMVNGGRLLDCRSNRNMITEGAIPKETRSANESNCWPKLLFAFSILAKNPSRKSRTAAMSIKYEANIRS